MAVKISFRRKYTMWQLWYNIAFIIAFKITSFAINKRQKPIHLGKTWRLRHPIYSSINWKLFYARGKSIIYKLLIIGLDEKTLIFWGKRCTICVHFTIKSSTILSVSLRWTSAISNSPVEMNAWWKQTKQRSTVSLSLDLSIQPSCLNTLT